MKVIAKCNNFSGCLVAYRGEKIELADGAAPVCPECGKPLTPVSGGPAVVKLAIIGAAVVVLAGAAFFGVKAISHRKPAPPKPDDAGQTAQTGTPEPVVPDGTDSDTPVKPPSLGPDATTGPQSTIVDATPPAPAKADNTPVSEDVRAEVLKRIDAMPNIAAEKKDKLYNSVRRARDMRRVLVVSFGSGQQAIPAAEKNNVKNLLASAEVMKFRDDLTAVFVVLGFADAKGNEKSNQDISNVRAKSVKDFMNTTCGVKNVTHEIGMGGSKLVDDQKLAKNRVVEIWAVLP